MRSLLEELIQRRKQGTLQADDRLFGTDFSPLSEPALASAEAKLGFGLTPTLRQIYATGANGGFGPSYGVLGLLGGMRNEDGNDAVDQFSVYRENDPDDPLWAWPQALLPFVHLGCAIYFCVDCTRQEGPIIWFEPNPHEFGEPWNESFIPFAASTEELLFSWLNGENLLERFLGAG